MSKNDFEILEKFLLKNKVVQVQLFLLKLSHVQKKKE